MTHDSRVPQTSRLAGAGKRSESESATGGERSAKQIVRDRVHVYQSRLNAKSSFHGTGWAWHQDFNQWYRQDGMARPQTVVVGIYLDPDRNTRGAPERKVSADGSSVEIWTVPTNEELVVARQSKALLLSGRDSTD